MYITTEGEEPVFEFFNKKTSRQTGKILFKTELIFNYCFVKVGKHIINWIISIEGLNEKERPSLLAIVCRSDKFSVVSSQNNPLHMLSE